MSLHNPRIQAGSQRNQLRSYQVRRYAPFGEVRTSH